MNSFFARRSQLIISQRIKTHLFKYFILFWHAIVFVAQKCWQVATNKKKSFSLLIFFYSKFWRHCAGPRPRPASVYTRVVKVSRLVLFSPVSSYWSDAKMWCDAHFLFKLASRLKFSHLMSPPWVSEMRSKNIRITFIMWGTWRSTERQTMETVVWENIFKTKIIISCVPRTSAGCWQDRCISCRNTNDEWKV